MEKMTFLTLQQLLREQQTVDMCSVFLINNAPALRTLFYSGISESSVVAPNQVCEQEVEAEDALIAFLNCPCCYQLSKSGTVSPELSALLIYFISYCERIGSYHKIELIAQIIPDGLLRRRATAIFKYKYITRASADYIDQFYSISGILQSVWESASPQIKAQCEDLAIEFFCSAADPKRKDIAEKNRTELLSRFYDVNNQVRFPFLAGKHLVRVLNLSADRLPREQKDANARIAECFYDEAALLLPVPQQPLHDTVCAESKRSHNGHCPYGLHPARVSLANEFATEFSEYKSIHKATSHSGSIY
jgi:hypothetical protein